MFQQKVKSLPGFEQDGPTTQTSAFVTAGLRNSNSNKTTSLGNGALKLISTGDDFIDQFGKATEYRDLRDYAIIAADMERLWSQDPLKTLKFTVYLRNITRQTILPEGVKLSKVQIGQGLKHEGIYRIMWIAINHPEVFWKNVEIFIAAGCWKDVFQMLSCDLMYHGWENRKLDWEKFGELLIFAGAQSETTQLIRKYMPTIRTRKKCKTLDSQCENVVAKWFCSLLFGAKPLNVPEGAFYGSTYKQYRKLKANGTAHTWQQLISRKQMDSLDFKAIHGRALSKLVGSKFLENQGLTEKYEAWISSQPIAKYTGYPYELLAPVKIGYSNTPMKTWQLKTIDAQFMGLVETAKTLLAEGQSGYIVVVDSSSSMTNSIPGTKASSYSVAKAMALYFSYLLKGPFAGTFMEFNDKAGLIEWKGKTPTERLRNDRAEAYGSTNFQSVAQTLIDIKNQGVKETDFPTGLLCISDGCFNQANLNKTNVMTLRRVLLDNAFSREYVENLKIVFWDVPNGFYGGKPQTAFEAYKDVPNVFHMSGLDPAAVSFLFGDKENKEKPAPKTSEELFAAAMDQELLNLLVI